MLLHTPFTAARAGNEDPAVFDAVCRAVGAAVANAGARLVDPAADHRAGTIMDHVRAAIDEADVIVALVTGENPNVYYELGWARREAIILVRDKNLPFDIRGDRYWVYGGLSQDELTARLREVIEQSLARSPTSKQAHLEAQIKQFFSTPLRHADEANVFDQLGVWRSPEASIQSREPAYVSRCSDTKLEKAIQSRKITVVKGPSKAGKSRSAAQALRAVAGNRVLLIPRPGLSNSLAVVIRLAIQIANAAPDQWHILWLDDLDKYLRASLLEHSDVEHSYRSPRWPRWQQFEHSHCKRCKKVMTITPGAPNICW